MSGHNLYQLFFVSFHSQIFFVRRWFAAKTNPTKAKAWA